MGDYPKMLYRGSFASQAALEAAWNSQSGIEQKQVKSVGEQLEVMKLGFVEMPSEMVVQAAGPAPKKGSRDEPLNVNR